MLSGNQPDIEPNMEPEFTNDPPAAKWRSAVHPGGATAYGHRVIR